MAIRTVPVHGARGRLHTAITIGTSVLSTRSTWRTCRLRLTIRYGHPATGSDIFRRYDSRPRRNREYTAFDDVAHRDRGCDHGGAVFKSDSYLGALHKSAGRELSRQSSEMKNVHSVI